MYFFQPRQPMKSNGRQNTKWTWTKGKNVSSPNKRTTFKTCWIARKARTKVTSLENMSLECIGTWGVMSFLLPREKPTVILFGYALFWPLINCRDNFDLILGCLICLTLNLIYLYITFNLAFKDVDRQVLNLY